MAKKIEIGLDASGIIRDYRAAITAMEQAGAKSSITSGLTKSLDRLEEKFRNLQNEGAFGKESSREIQNYQKRVDSTFSSLGQLGKELERISKDKKAFPTSSIMEFEKKLEEAKKKVIETQQAFAGQFQKLGFSAQVSDEISKTVKSEDEVIKKLEEELKIRKALEDSLKAAADEARKQAGQKVTASGSGKSLLGSDDISAGFGASAGFKAAEVKEIRQDLNKMFAEAIRDGQDFASVWQNGIKNSMFGSEEQLKNFVVDVDALKQKIEEVIKKRDELAAKSEAGSKYNEAVKSRSAIGDISSGGDVTFSAEAQATIDGTTAALQSMTNASAAATAQEQQRTVAENQNKVAMQGVTAATQRLTSDTESMRNNFSNSTKALYDTTKAAENASASFDQMTSRILTMLSATSVLNLIKKTIKETYEDVKQLDKSFASIAMVTSYSVNEMWSSYSQYAEMASNLGQKTDDMIKASALFYQQGLNTNEALALTTDTMKLATLAGNDFETATQEMTSAIRGFKMEMDEGGRVTDVYSTLAAHAAASVDDIAQAMARTASIANSAGMSFENTSAFLTQMIETTQESAENIGTSLKTIIARFTELKENVAGTADSEFDDLEFNKVDKALKSVGVELKDTTGQFRNLDQVFLDLSEKWDTLDRNTQRYVATIAAGSRQQSRFIAMMDSYDRTVELMELAADAEGKADEQFAKYADTMEYKLNQLNTKWEEFRVNALDSDFFKGMIDGLSNFLDRLKNVDFKRAIAVAPFAIWAAKTFITNVIATIKTSAAAFTSIGQFMGKKIGDALSKKFPRIKAKIDVQAAQAEVDRLGNLIESQKKKYGNINYQILVNANGAEGTIKTLEQNFKDLALTDDEATAKLREFAMQLGLTEQEANELSVVNGTVTDTTGKFTTAANNATTAVRNLNQEQQKNVANAEKVQQSAQLTSMAFQGVASAMVMAISAGISGAASLEDVGKMMIKSMAGVAAQLAIQWVSIAVINKTGGEAAGAAVGNGINAGLASTGVGLIIVAIGLAIGAIVLALGKAFSVYKDTHKSLEQQLAEAKESVEELEKSAKEAKAKAKESKQTLKNTQDLKKEFQELQLKQHRTTEEQERYNELVEKIQDEYPELISYYNEVTGELRIQDDVWDKIIDKQTKAVELAQKQSYYSQVQLDGAQRNLATIQNSLDIAKKYGFDSSTLNGVNRGSEYEGLKKRITNATNMISGSGYTAAQKREFLTEGIAYDSQGYSISTGLGGLDTDVLANLYGINPKDFTNEDAIEDAIIDAIGKDNQKIIDFLSDGVDQLASNNELLKQAEYESNADAYAEYYKSAHEDASDAEVLLAKTLNETAQKTNELHSLTADEYHDLAQDAKDSGDKGENNKSFFNALGGARAGASSNSFSDWEDLNKNNEIQGLEAYNIKKVQDVQDALIKALGSEADAMAFWEENQGTAAGQTKIFNAVIAQAVSDLSAALAEESLEKNKAYMSGLTDKYKEASEGGVTQKEIDALEVQIGKMDLTPEEEETMRKNFIEPFEQQLQQATENAINAGLKEADVEGWSSDLMNAYAQVIDKIAEDVPESMAKAFGKESFDLLKKQGLEGEEIISALQDIDWTAANAGNFADFKKATKEQFKEMGIEDTEAFFNEWSKIAEEKGVLDITISNVAELDEFVEKLEEIQEMAYGHKDDLIEAIAEQAEKGTVSLDKFLKMKKAIEEMGGDIFDYAEVDKTGKIIIKDQEAIEKLYKSQTNQMVEQLKQQKAKTIEEHEQFLKQEDTFTIENNILKSKTEELETGYKNVEVQDAYNKELMKTVALYEALGIKVDASKLAGINALSGLSELQSAAVKSYIDETNAQLAAAEEKRQKDRELKEQQYKEVMEQYDRDIEEASKLGPAYARDWDESMAEALKDTEKGIKSVTDAEKDRTEALEKLKEAEEDVADKQEKLNDKLKEYNDLLYGKDNRKSTLDYLYNYDEAISSFNDEITRSKDLLSDAKSVADSTAALERYAKATHNLIAEETAKQEVIAAGLKNYASMIENGSYAYTNSETGQTTNINFGDYARKDERTGKYVIDQRLLNEARFTDEIKDLLEEQVSTYNKYSEEYLKTQDNIRKAEKELQEERKTALKNYTAMETEIAEALKAQYQEEVDALKDKYDSMKDADDDYLDALQDAIEKQRKLRDQEDKYEDLAKQEKKLSLMQRDTSGANELETRKLEEDIQKTREDLLDEAIDQVIDGLSELYESQQELRDSELELKEALLDNTLYWNQQAEGLAGSFESAEDYAQFLSSLSEEYSMMTLAQQQLKLQEYGETYTAATEYMAMQAMDASSTTGDFIVETMTITGEEVGTIVAETAETFTTEVTRSYNETTAAFQEDMAKAEESIKSARDALAEAVQKLNECGAAANAAAEALRQAQAAEAAGGGGGVDGGGITSSSTESYIDWIALKNAVNGESYRIAGTCSSHTIAYGPCSSATHAGLADNVQNLFRGNNIEALQKVATAIGVATDGNVKELYERIKQKMIDDDYSVNSVFKYKSGGLVDYTGPAWVDGSTEQPEAFLSSEDTARIGEAAKILADIPWMDRDTTNASVVTNNGGDVSVEINLNIDHISSDTDIDEMIQRVKDEIVDVARPEGTNVILQQQLN